MRLPAALAFAGVRAVAHPVAQAGRMVGLLAVPAIGKPDGNEFMCSELSRFIETFQTQGWQVVQ